MSGTEDRDVEEIIRHNDRFYITANSALVDDRTRVLKHGDTFLVADRFGDIQPISGKQGLYHGGTRFLSRWSMRFGNERPLMLSSTVKQDNVLFSADLTNPDLIENGQLVVPRGTIHIFRAKLLWKGVCYERLRVTNFGLTPVEVLLTFQLEADYMDIFEVRGARRERRGRLLPPTTTDASIVHSYEGLDKTVRRTRIECVPRPTALSATGFSFHERLDPKGEAVYWMTAACESTDGAPYRLSFDSALEEAENALGRSWIREAHLETRNSPFNNWLDRSVSDLHMMVTQLPQGPYPYAGVPWFSTVFGRDGILTALQALWLNPGIARGVLNYLASTQAREVVPEEDAEPGKILHETRVGEMAALKEIPFGRYYGSVDATPLFVILAGAYYERTADRAFIESIWPNLELALAWIDRFGDADGDGFVEYAQRSAKGLRHQGWKDSQDCVFHADGAPAEGPIALCEVQGYVYAAKRAASDLAWVLRQPQRAAALMHEAKALKERFDETFWSEEIGSYVLALDGEKRPCKVRTSNAGHALFSGIASEERARRVADALFQESSFSGWGIRTVDAAESRYNPMSYHNGSVWPHDNALIAQGLARYGFKEQAVRLFTALFDCSTHVDLHRLPELYCGFRRRPSEGPTLYPVACAPQAWASGSVFMLIQAALGLTIKGPESQLAFSRPVLPRFLEHLTIRNLRVGKASIDLQLEGRGNDVDVNILRREGSVEVAVFK
jgi:glycogen debranching enzyme